MTRNGMSRSAPGMLALRPAGHLACFVFAVLVPIAADGTSLVAASAVVLAVVVAFQRRGLTVLADWRAWTLVALLATPAALLTGRADRILLGVPVAGEGLLLGASIATRAFTLLLGVAGFASSVSVSELTALLERGGLKGVGFALGVAVNAFPTVVTSFATTFHAIRLRGGFRARRLRSVRLLLITVVTRSLQHAEQVVSAAEARGFSVDRARRLPPLAGSTDAGLVAALVVLGLVILRF